jgi:hypothetical protein
MKIARTRKGKQRAAKMFIKKIRRYFENHPKVKLPK